MAKYYVQSGTIRSIIDSADAERAALWAVHQAMDATLPLDGCEEMCQDDEVCHDADPVDDVSNASTLDSVEDLWTSDSWNVESWGLSCDRSPSVASDEAKTSASVTQPVVRLSETIRISERGFDREDAMVFDTLEMFRHWFELYNAVTVLASRLSSSF